MPLRETLQKILIEYPAAGSEPLEGHPLAQLIRGEAENSVTEVLGSDADLSFSILRMRTIP